MAKLKLTKSAIEAVQPQAQAMRWRGMHWKCLPSKVMAANYRTVLPDAELLQKELEATRRLLESRTSKQPKKLQQ